MSPNIFDSGAKGAGFQRSLTDPSASAFRRYQQLVIGGTSIWALIKYEAIVTLAGGFPGALGLLMRKLLYPKLLRTCGKGVIWGRNVVIRHGQKIKIGDGVIIDDNVVLDAKGSDNQGITIEDQSMISRNTILSCKNGDIRVGSDSSIGINCLIHAETGSNVEIGAQNLIAAYVYFVGGGTYPLENKGVPMKEIGTYSRGGIKLGSDVWIGANVQILDGVSIQEGAIVAAGAVVNQSVAANCVVGGIPAKTLKHR